MAGVAGAKNDGLPRPDSRASAGAPWPSFDAVAAVQDRKADTASATERRSDGGSLPTLSRPVLDLARADDGRSVTARVVGVLLDVEGASTGGSAPQGKLRGGSAEGAMSMAHAAGAGSGRPVAPGAEVPTVEALVGAREPGGRFTLATPLGAFVTLARNLGLAPGMRLLVQIAPTARAGDGPTHPAAGDAGPARTANAGSGRVAASEARPVLAEASALLGRVPQLRLTLLSSAMPATTAPLREAALPAAATAEPAPPPAEGTRLAASATAAALAVRSAQRLAERHPEAAPAGARKMRNPAPAAGDRVAPSAEGNGTGRTGGMRGSHPTGDARVVVAPRSAPLPAGTAGAVAEPSVVAPAPPPSDTPSARVAGEPAAGETPPNAQRGETAGGGAPPAVPPPGPTYPSGLLAVLEREARAAERGAGGDGSGHAVIAVELRGLGTVELHLHWTERDLLVALAVTGELPPALRRDLTTALARFAVDQRIGRSPIGEMSGS